jgi:hypothetical protein
MHRNTRSPRRTSYRLAGTLILAALAGCTEPSGLAPTASPLAPAASPSAIIIIGGHPIVLTAQLRAIGNPNEIGNPDEKPLSAVVGHIQLKITGTVETGLVVDWQAHFANPECDASTAFGGGSVMVQDSEEMPSPEDVAVLRLIPPGDPLGCGDNFLEGSSAISEAIAAVLIHDPEDFVAAFFIIDGGVIAGTLQVAGNELPQSR